MKIIQMLVMGVLLTAGLEAQVSQAAKPTMPTEYSQCDTMNSRNMTARVELSKRWSKCHLDCTYSTCNGLREESASCGWGGKTWGSCFSLLQDLCQFENQAKSAYDECRGKVAQYKQLRGLYTAGDAENDKMAQLLRKIRDGANDFVGEILDRPVSDLFGYSTNMTVNIALGARKQLDDSIDAWANGDLYPQGLTLPRGFQLYKHGERNEFYNLIRAIHALKSNGAVKYLERDEFFEALTTVRGLEQGGDERAAYILGYDFLGGSDKAALLHFLRSALKGYIPSINGVGFCLWRLGYLEKAEDWFEFGVTKGSETSKGHLVQVRNEIRQQKTPTSTAPSYSTPQYSPPQAVPAYPVETYTPPSHTAPERERYSAPPAPQRPVNDCWARNPCGTYNNGKPYPCGGTQSEQCVDEDSSSDDDSSSEKKEPRWKIAQACQNVVTQCRSDCRREWNTSRQGSAERDRMRLCALQCESDLRECTEE